MSNRQPQLNCVIVGASGYTGVALAAYLQRHPAIHLSALLVSAHSMDVGKRLSDLHPTFKGCLDLPLLAMDPEAEEIKRADVVFLATAHEISHDLAPLFLAMGCVVFDLSGAYRVNDKLFYQDYYSFTHQHHDWLAQAVYGLAEWRAEEIRQAQLIAIPGCYPTVSQLALKPLIEGGLLDLQQWPVINAVSGVSGAGRKASLTTSFCEVSLQPYGLFTHRHQPEIAAHLGTPVIFIPHLGSFSRGILATITSKLQLGITEQQVRQVYQQAYQHKPLVRLYDRDVPSINAIVGTPFCDIGCAQQGQHLIVVAAEDNILKGAAAQAVQCMNIRFGFAETQSLL